MLAHKCLPIDPPPKVSKHIHKHDAIDKPKLNNRSIKDLRNYLKLRSLSIKGRTQHTCNLCNESNAPIETKDQYGKIIKGCAVIKLSLIEAS